MCVCLASPYVPAALPPSVHPSFPMQSWNSSSTRYDNPGLALKKNSVRWKVG
ncbi:hypothetical protein M422DRAFT_31194 [Sphaerobolus stellatus SS14]|uniref:Uncharacterized protein n=1 Tax=Sphaerobolus stellatus (strain SS14) TaxID=990650 RepID=A0A0C9VMA1_SPHS4|nr:hypothetical protein M422DRAFT_31194 [Sphaerobolus stellatus SS14]